MMFLYGVNILPKVRGLGQQRQEEARREGVQEINLMQSTRQNLPDTYTQTQAHEQIKKMRELIQEKFKDKVVPYFDIISRMVTKEAELKDTHYVFYHAAPTMLTIMTDLYTQLYFNAHPEAKDAAADNTFRFLRFQGQSTDVSARQFVEKEMRAHGLVDDKTKELMAILLSVNLSLFGSVGSETESTWLRFIKNNRTIEKWQEDEIAKMMDHFGVTKKYIKDILALDKYFSITPEAALIQIFIPKKMVDSLVYLAWIRGVPASGPIMEWIKEYRAATGGNLEGIKGPREKLMKIFQEKQEKDPMFKSFMEDLGSGQFSTYAYLKAYCNKPAEVPYLNDTQGRILFTKEGLLNPASGIQFHYYFSTPREKIEEYATKLNAIVEKLIAEKGQKAPSPKPAQQGQKAPAPKAAQQRQTAPAPKAPQRGQRAPSPKAKK
jgi:hypothetical protein